jgi:UDP-N-acetylmuramyl pentapeptide phosphotransferase/UDP-N-acetylglucosamine-1-phosphate transferase
VDGWSHPFDARWWCLLLISFVLAAFVTWLSIRYAHRRKLIDLPGQRRSHTVPTPRGGGIGIVVAVLVSIVLFSFANVGSVIEWPRLAISVSIVAAVGWIDDHGGLRARWRFLGHCIAVLLLLWPLGAASTQSANILLVTIFAVAAVWSINLHNFMDGIDGILSTQAIFVFVALFAISPNSDAAQLPIWSAAVVGFLPFNFPRARIFMGDVGSGVLGLLIAVAVILQLFTPSVPQSSGILACSAFATDATCTLLSRMLSGRRWYSAHREHLYQWMTRAGMSHARVVAWYAAWNLLIVTPVLWSINRNPSHSWMSLNELSLAITVYVFAVIVWIIGKRWCLHKVKSKSHHAST